MKAIDYAEKYYQLRKNEKNHDKIISSIIKDFLDETDVEIRDKHCQRDSAVYGILESQDQKWKAFCKLTSMQFLNSIYKSAALDEYPELKNFDPIKKDFSNLPKEDIDILNLVFGKGGYKQFKYQN